MAEATHKAPTAPQYSLRDEADLIWFHGIGQTAFERSTFGGMLDRAQQFGGMKQSWPRVAVLNDDGAVIGYESGITARPTAECREISGYVPDEVALTRYAHVSSIMMRVERADALAATVIACLFGDAVRRWSGGAYGRLGALFVLTAKGKALVSEAAKAPGAIEMTAAQRIESLCTVQAVQPKPERAEALAICMRQAEALELRARVVWHQVRSSER